MPPNNSECACKYCSVYNGEGDNCDWAGGNCVCKYHGPAKLQGYMGHLHPDTQEPVIEPHDPARYYTLPAQSRLYILASDPESALKTYQFVLHQLTHSKWK